MKELMRPEYKNLTVTLTDIARTGAIGPIKVGSSLPDFGDILGTPKYWGFPRYDDFDAYMGFGGVEVGFELRDKVVQVRHMKVELRSYSKRIIPFCRGGRLGARISISALPFENRKIDPMRLRLRQAGIEWSEESHKPWPEGVSTVMSFPSGTLFLFSMLAGSPLEIVEIF